MRANHYLLILALVIASPSFAQQIQTADKLYQNFQTPVNEAKPRLWWHWMNGNITKEGIQKDLESGHYKCPKNRENLLELRVTNTWVNRLIGDSRAGAAQKTTFTTMPFYQANSPLVPSGLLGEVKVLVVE